MVAQFHQRGIQAAMLCIVACTASLLPSCDSAERGVEAGQPSAAGIAQEISPEDEYCGDAGRMSDPMALEAASLSGDFRVRILQISEPVPSNRIFPLRIEVQGPDELSVDRIRVRADAAMPHHGHGMTVKPVAHRVESKPGVFEIAGMMFHMPGEWELYIDIIDGPYTERVTFHALAR